MLDNLGDYVRAARWVKPLFGEANTEDYVSVAAIAREAAAAELQVAVLRLGAASGAPA